MIAINPQFDWRRFAGNALQDIGYGLGRAPTVAGGFAAGAERSQDMQPYRDQQAMLEEERRRDALEKNQTSEWIKANFPQYSNLPPAQAWQAAIGELAAQRQATVGPTANMRDFQFAQENPGFADFLNGGQGDVTTGFTPIAGKIDGKDAFAFPGNDGRYYVDGKPIPPGSFTPTSQFDVNANKAAGTNFGKQTGDAQFDIPSAKLTMDQTVAAIEAVRANTTGADEQFGNILGIPQQVLPAWPGSPKADFRNSVSRATNLAFMQAREMLRGGGQITDFESRKAETAITNMQIAMENGSKPAFDQALTDFEQAVKDGYAKLERQAATMPGYGGLQPAGQSTSTGVQWSYEP